MARRLSITSITGEQIHYETGNRSIQDLSEKTPTHSSTSDKIAHSPMNQGASSHSRSLSGDLREGLKSAGSRSFLTERSGLYEEECVGIPSAFVGEHRGPDLETYSHGNRHMERKRTAARMVAKAVRMFHFRVQRKKLRSILQTLGKVRVVLLCHCDNWCVNCILCVHFNNRVRCSGHFLRAPR